MKYQKKPVVIEAVQWFKHGDHPAVEEIADCEDQVGEKCLKCGHFAEDHGSIETLEGAMVACPGDWIITGVKGEHYPCKPDIFDMTYEKADTEDKRYNPTVEEALKEYAKQHGFDGLIGDGDACGCSIDDGLYQACYALTCALGYVCPCKFCEAEIRENCNAFDYGDLECMVLPEKCEMRIKIEKEREQQAHGRAEEAGADMDGGKQHPTQKPLDLMMWCVAKVDSKIIIDPYMGSGSTGVAAVNLGREFVGIEREWNYYNIALHRIKLALAQGTLF